MSGQGTFESFATCWSARRFLCEDGLIDTEPFGVWNRAPNHFVATRRIWRRRTHHDRQRPERLPREQDEGGTSTGLFRTQLHLARSQVPTRGSRHRVIAVERDDPPDSCIPPPGPALDPELVAEPELQGIERVAGGISRDIWLVVDDGLQRPRERERQLASRREPAADDFQDGRVADPEGGQNGSRVFQPALVVEHVGIAEVDGQHRLAGADFLHDGLNVRQRRRDLPRL